MSNLSQNQSNPFDSIRHVDEQGNEFWYGRELMPLLEYAKWQRFEDVIDRAKISCKVAGFSVEDHFIHLPGSVSGKGRTGDNYKLSRYGCHLTAMNGDVRKPAIALAQSYFSLSTTKLESVAPPTPSIPILPPAQQLVMATDALRVLGVELDNPRYAQGLRDWALNLIGVTALPATNNERWLGAAERAEELGFGRIGANHSTRVRLGQWIGKAKLSRRREKRLCNGEDREIWCYLVCDQLDKAISDFFQGIAKQT
jgi:hypothetical protein